MVKKRLQRILSLLTVVSLAMSLLSVTAFAEESAGSAGEATGCFGCGMELHVHGENCYRKELACTKTEADLELNCTGHTEHGEGCYENHAHVEGTCNTVVPVSENWLCTESTEPQLVCPVTEPHVHMEECYIPHVHDDDCYITVLTCQLPVHEAHTDECLTEVAKAMVDAVKAQAAAAPRLVEMHAARGTTYAATKTYSAEQAAADYASYISDCFAKRAAAQVAYDALPAELKPFVSADDLKNLTDVLETEFTPASASITKGEDGYNFQSVYTPAYEMSCHAVAMADGTGVEIPQTLLLVNADRDYEWRMDGPYVNGESNYEVLYCCDIETMYKNGVHYKRLNLEDSPYYSEDAAKHIRSIVMNSYPYVSLDRMKADLASGGFKDADKLTRADAIAAVQTAIWSYANNVQGEYVYNKTFDQSYVTQAGWGSIVHNYNNELYDWWNVGTRKYYTNTTAGTRINDLVDYLTNLGPVAPKQNEIIITSVEIVEAPVLGNNGRYEVLLKVVLNSGGSSAQDNLTLSATVGEGTDATVETKEVKQGQTVYYMLVSAAFGDTITVKVSGTQNLPTGVYFYEPKPADVNGDGSATAREVSQNLVGVAMGETPVSVEASMLFTAEMEFIDTAELPVRKVDGGGNPLGGAEFTLYADVDGDNVMVPIKTYVANEQGKTEDIVDLIPGVIYELKETKVPTGYIGVNDTARFEVVMDGENAVVRMISLPYGMAYAPNGEGVQSLTITNTLPSHSTDGGGGNTPTPDSDVTIVDEDPPLAGLPEEDVPLVELPEEDVPLAKLPEEDVSLADVPMTGDMSMLWMAMTALSGAGLVGVTLLGRKKREDL